MALNVISRPTNVIMKLSAIIKIHKCIGFHEKQHFILMAMEVHGAPRRDMDRFIRECAHLFFTIGDRKTIFFCIQFFKQCVSIAFLCALAFAIKTKIALPSDGCFRPPIIIKFHDLHTSNIRGVD